MGTKYRPDIDGLRAVAVSAVLLFHAEVPGFEGGFVGVDVFFVISGFLITSIIAGETDRDGLSLARFYERRIRRIFPAFFVMLLVVFLTGLALHDELELARLGKNAIAATVFVSNVVFWRESGYFAPSAETNPLLHTWSLSVEEQFYVFFPLAMSAMSSRAPRALKPCLLAVTVVSVALAAWGAFRFPGSTFYLLPTRSWELLAGSLLALGVLGTPRSVRQASVVAMLGLLLIAASVVLYSDQTPFPGLAAIPPVAGAAMLIWSGTRDISTSCGRLLAWKPIVFVGLISYSLYLWHWPIIAFWKYVAFRPMEWLDSLTIVALSILLGTLSWRYVERPFRANDGILRERSKVFAIGGLAMVLAVGAGGWIWSTGGLPGRFETSASHVAVVNAARDSTAWDRHADWERMTESLGTSLDVQPPIVGPTDTRPTFAFVGDSHARALIPAIESQVQRVGIAGYVITRRSTPPLHGVGIKQVPRGDDGFDEVRYHEGLVRFLAESPQVTTVILAARWPAYIRGHYTERGEDHLDCELSDDAHTARGTPARAQMVERGLDRLVDLLVQMNRTVILVGCVPEIGVDVPTAFGIASRLPWLLDLQRVPPSRQEVEHRQQEARQLLDRISSKHQICFVSPDADLWASGDRVSVIHEGKLLYRDDDHLSDAGAQHVAPSFDMVFNAMAGVSRAPQ